MRRYFYSGNLLTKTWLDRQFNLVRKQDQIYRDALLAALKLDPTKSQHENFTKLRQTVLDMTMQQQKQYSNNYHMEQVFTHLQILHRNTRGRKMMVRGTESLIKDIVDPDKFPIWDLKKKPNVYYSIWNTVMGGIRHDIGHQLVVKNSLVQHPEGGRGVFVHTSASKKRVEIGQLLGFVPGTYYDTYQSYKKIRLQKMNSFQKQPQHLHFPSGKVLQLCEYKFTDQVQNKQMNIQPCMINPYSVGQFVNHPPYGCLPNVIFTQIQSKFNFFPKYLLKYLPYNAEMPIEVKKKDQKHIIFGIFATKTIQNGEQLYVDYNQNHIYPIERVPEWMIQPDYQPEQQNKNYLNFSKQQYEYPSPRYWKLLENQALEKNKQLYEKYMKTVKYRPNKVIFENDGEKISSMNLNN